MLSGVGASAADSITWYAITEPPAVISEGPLSGQGAQERQVEILSRALPAFASHRALAPPMRVLHELQHRDGVCSIGLARLPERLESMTFSARPMVSPGYGIILREDRLPEFRRYVDAAGALDLEKLKGARLTGGYVAVRPHFQVLKDFIEAGYEYPALIASADTPGLFRRVASRRIDFLFGLRDETNYFAETVGAGARLVSLPIAGMDPFGASHIACSNGPIGRRVIAAVDDWLADRRHWAEFVEPWKRWLGPADYAAALTGQTSPVK